MKWIEAKVIFDSPNPQVSSDLISNIFFELGLQGVSLEDPFEEPVEGWGADALKKPEHYSVSGYFPINELDEKKRFLLENQLSTIEKDNQILIRVVYRELDEEDWAESWKEYFWPEKITDKIVVKPSWREYKAKADELVVEIDPGMAFGTGTHPTTSLCMILIEKYLKPGDVFLDIGTGSGILMILSAKLGAEKIRGVDKDKMAVNIAEKNLIQNNIKPSKFKVVSGNLANSVNEKFNLIVANILSDVILILLDNITHVMAKNCTLICSGIIEENADSVIQKMTSLGFNIAEVLTKEKWVAIVAQYDNP